MSTALYIAADGGGTKLQTVLYDENFNVLRSARVAGVNTLYKPIETVRANVEGMLATLLEGLAEDGELPVIRSADLCLIGAGDVMKTALDRYARVETIRFHSEPVVGLAASLRTDGVLTLSGTGSDAFFVKDRRCTHAVGGWGPLLGDEGSGYEIGLRALKAAIYSYDGRREHSMLYDLIMEEWGLERLWDMVSPLASDPDARHKVASVARICSKAAHAGDRTALSIYEHAALELALQTRTVIDQCRDQWDGTVAVTGSAWKGHPRMFEVFSREIELNYPEARVNLPVYEAVVGCVFLRAYADGMDVDVIRAGLERGFADYRYR